MLTEENPAELPPPKVKFSFLRVNKILLGALVLIGVLVGGSFLASSRTVKIAWASIILDNREHYLDCYSLPFYPQVEKALADHADIVEKIQALGTEQVNAVQIKCKGWDGGIEFIKGDILIEYSTHNQRAAIEKLVGDNFFGIPYRGKNR